MLNKLKHLVYSLNKLIQHLIELIKDNDEPAPVPIFL